MINFKILNAAILCMRSGFNQRPTFSYMQDLYLSTLLSESNEAIPVESYSNSYISALKPEYIQDYFISPEPTSEEDYVGDDLTFDTSSEGFDERLVEYGELVEETFGITLYNDTDLWVKQSDMFYSLFAKNNGLYCRKGGFENTLYEIEYKSIRTTTSTRYNGVSGEYITSVSTSESDGEHGTSLNDRTGISKETSYNAFLDEFYVSEEIVYTCKLRIILTELGQAWIDTYKVIVTTEYDEEGTESIIYNTGFMSLVNNEWIDKPVPDDFTPLDYEGTKSAINNTLYDLDVYSFKVFNTYQDLIAMFE